MIVRYLHMGHDVTEIGPNIRERLIEAVNLILDRGSLDSMIRFCQDSRGYGIDPDSTWPKLLKELLRQLQSPPEGGDERISVFLGVLRDVLSLESRWARWERSKGLLTQHADVLSGWSSSWQRQWAQREPVQLRDSRYYAEIRGEESEIIGRRTGIEERWTFIAHSCEQRYGLLHVIIRLMALINICEVYIEDPGRFPPRIQLFLPEGQMGTSFALWQWRLRSPRQWLLTEWYPPEVLCNPSWLASDLVAFFTGGELVLGDELPPEVGDEIMRKWMALSGQYGSQMDIVVESDAIFGRTSEVWFEFRGRPLRWFNRTGKAEAVLMVPVDSGSDSDPEYEFVQRFLSQLVYSTGSRMKTSLATVSGFHAGPEVGQSRGYGGVQYPSWDGFRELQGSGRLDVALALYREGVNSGSVYYSFLSFFKVAQLAFGERGKEVDSWLRENLLRLQKVNIAEWLREGGVDPHAVGEYLYASGRCAIAHVAKDPIVDPDSASDMKRIGRDVPIVQAFAQLAIDDGLFRASDQSGPMGWQNPAQG
jgi:hypothetical protein